MKYYIATKLENHAAHNALRDILNKRGHEITYDWTHHGPVYSHGLERVREVAELEINGVLAADVVIVLWPGGRGTHVEMGAALAQNKPVVFVSDIEAHHKATTETCAFYHSASVTRCKDFRDVAPILTEFAARQPAEVQEPVAESSQYLQLPPLTDIMYHAVRGSEYHFGHGETTVAGYLDDDCLDDIWDNINTALRVSRTHPAPLPDTVSVPDAWMPIETAPRDGTVIMAWCVHNSAKYSKDPIKEGWAAPVIASWTDFNHGGWTWHGHAGTFTHWQPLPAAPHK